MTCFCSVTHVEKSPHYFVVMEDFRSAGMEARVAPEIDRAEVISRLKTRNYKDVLFIHEIQNGTVRDVTMELLGEARNLILPDDSAADRQAWTFDRARDERKHAEPA